MAMMILTSKTFYNLTYIRNFAIKRVVKDTRIFKYF